MTVILKYTVGQYISLCDSTHCVLQLDPRNCFLEHLKSESMRVSKRHPFMERWNKHVEIFGI